MGAYVSYPDASHQHGKPSGEIQAIQNFLCMRVPLEIAQRIMDLVPDEDAEALGLELGAFWHSCKRQCRELIRVSSSGREPMGVRGVHWENGQEGELADWKDKGGLRDANGNVWCVASGPVGCGDEYDGKHWVRAIVVETLSRDQSWADSQADYGTYRNSFSWFELSLVRDGEEVPDSRCTIQHNVVAGQYFKDHRILLEGNHPLVRGASDGDRVVLWARAQYPGWENNVKRSAITVFTSRFPPA